MSGWGWFSGDPILEFLDDGRRVKVAKHFWYRRPNDDVVTVTAGFVCDGASIPRALWPFAGGPFEGKHRDAAIIHDQLYSLGRAGQARYTRSEADRVFYEGMRCSGVGAFEAWTKYAAVRVFGPRW